MDKLEILRLLRAGYEVDDICSNFTKAVNAAVADYEKEQEDDKRRAAMGVAADKAAAALTDYFKLKYPGQKFAPITGDILDIIADDIMYGKEDEPAPKPKAKNYEQKSNLNNIILDFINSLNS